MPGKFGFLAGESLVWPEKLTGNNLKPNLKFHSVEQKWHYTVTCLTMANIRHNVQCSSLFCGIANDKTVYVTISRIKVELSNKTNFVSSQNY